MYEHPKEKPTKKEQKPEKKRKNFFYCLCVSASKIGEDGVDIFRCISCEKIEAPEPTQKGTLSEQPKRFYVSIPSTPRKK